jgi:hypothetical protein
MGGKALNSVSSRPTIQRLDDLPDGGVVLTPDSAVVQQCKTAEELVDALKALRHLLEA